MDITGKIIQALPEVSGTSRTGNPWKKREYVLETQETYPKKVFFNLFGDRADQYPLQVGQVVKLHYDLESREYNGRWYTDVRGWKVEDPGNAAAAPAAPAAPAPAPFSADAPGSIPPPPQPIVSEPLEDDLPF